MQFSSIGSDKYIMLCHAATSFSTLDETRRLRGGGVGYFPFLYQLGSVRVVSFEGTQNPEHCEHSP